MDNSAEKTNKDEDERRDAEQRNIEKLYRSMPSSSKYERGKKLRLEKAAVSLFTCCIVFFSR